MRPFLVLAAIPLLVLCAIKGNVLAAILFAVAFTAAVMHPDRPRRERLRRLGPLR